MVLFQLSNALLLPLAIEAGKDAWLAILLAMAVSMVLFFVYHALYRYDSKSLPFEYMEKLIGKVFGRILALLYILFFMFIAARVLRDYGEMLLTFAYPDTPLFVVSALLILVVIYAVYKGIEVIARTGEILFVFMFLLAIGTCLLIVSSGLVHLSNLRPILEDPPRIIHTVFTKTLYFPFGQIVVFLMVFPYLNQPKKMKKTGLLAIGGTGLILAVTMAINVSILGEDLTARSQFPYLATIQSIEVAGFLERLDVVFIVILVIGGFVKISVFFYGAVIGSASLFKVKKPSQLVYPMGVVILLLSMVIANSYAEHINEGLEFFTPYIELPFQVIIPVFLLMIAFFKNRKKKHIANQK